MTKSHGGRKLDTRTPRRRRSITLLSRGTLKASGLRDGGLPEPHNLAPLSCASDLILRVMPAVGSAWVAYNPVSTCSFLSCPAGNRSHGPRPSHRLRTRSYSALAVYVLLAYIALSPKKLAGGDHVVPAINS